MSSWFSPTTQCFPTSSERTPCLEGNLRRYPIRELGPLVLHFIPVDSVGEGEADGTRRSGVVDIGNNGGGHSEGISTGTRERRRHLRCFFASVVESLLSESMVNDGVLLLVTTP